MLAKIDPRAGKPVNPASLLNVDRLIDPIIAVENQAPGSGEPLGGLRVRAQNGWFAARPSGTEDVYKIYAESFLGPEHLERIQREAEGLISELFDKVVRAEGQG